MKARNSPAIGERGYERIEFDNYRTPPQVTKILFENINFPSPAASGNIWEPAAGSGDMAKVIKDYGYVCYTSDIRENLDHNSEGLDFVRSMLLPPRVQHVITNPPFNLADAFIERALSIIRQTGGMAAFLLPHAFDTALTSRGHLFAPPFYAKVPIGFRIRWLGLPTHDENGKPKPSPRENHAWYVWRAGYKELPVNIYRKIIKAD